MPKSKKKGIHKNNDIDTDTLEKDTGIDKINSNNNLINRTNNNISNNNITDTIITDTIITDTIITNTIITDTINNRERDSSSTELLSNTNLSTTSPISIKLPESYPKSLNDKPSVILKSSPQSYENSFDSIDEFHDFINPLPSKQHPHQSVSVSIGSRLRRYPSLRHSIRVGPDFKNQFNILADKSEIKPIQYIDKYNLKELDISNRENLVLSKKSMYNLLRGIPSFILEISYLMILTFLSFIGIICGLYSLKKMELIYMYLYSIVNEILIFNQLLTLGLVNIPNFQVILFRLYVIVIFLIIILDIAGLIAISYLRYIVTYSNTEGLLSLIQLIENPIFFLNEDEFETQILTDPLHAFRQVFYSPLRSLYSPGNEPSYLRTFLEIFGLPLQPGMHADNVVRKAKYNFATFWPRFLFEQFSRLANLYTLCIVSLCLTSFSPLSPVSAMTPLCIVLATAAIKEILEDYRRRQSDLETNGRLTQKLRSMQPEIEVQKSTFGASIIAPKSRIDQLEFISCCWSDLHTGDIVKVRSGEIFPADLILLSCSEETGRCFVETSSLDGETNLKVRVCPKETTDFRTVESFSKREFEITCELPNNRLYNFDGSLLITNVESNSQATTPLCAENLLLRGTTLKLTNWVIGIVVNSGVESKIENNTSTLQLKKSSVEIGVNNQLIFIFVLQMIICIYATTSHSRFNSHPGSEFMPWYLGYGNLKIIPTEYIYSLRIPLSMYVTMEMVRFYNARKITEDNRLSVSIPDRNGDEPKVISSQSRNASVVEELGQISYVFTDKTGTLTTNEMSFSGCSIDGIIYGDFSLHDAERTKMNNFVGSTYCAPTPYFSLPSLGVPSSFDDPMLLHNFSIEHSSSALIEEFLVMLAVCNTVSPEIKTLSNYTQAVEFQSCSPDESALVIGAKHLGVELKSKVGNIVTLNLFGQERTYEILNVLEFNSVRKRMSVICLCPDSVIRLFCKGADTTVLPRVLSHNQFSIDHLNRFASCGLRTLCLAATELTEELYFAWLKKYQLANASLDERQEKIDAVAEEIEQQLNFIGVTAIEDRLQDKVNESITKIRGAGIKVWVLTGDKLETAMSIGYSCGVLTKDMDIITFTETDETLLAKRLFQLCPSEENGKPSFWSNFNISKLFPYLPKVRHSFSGKIRALVIDGPTLFLALNPGNAFKFLTFARTCESVICCRCTPLQKGAVVDLVSDYSIINSQEITLAIGDGANDVPMIQKAHVGVGINDGKEGMQAAMASDFSIPRFSMLVPLLLKYGSRSYKRISKLILYSFIKNFALVFPLFLFGFFSTFSAQIIYFDFFFTLYNSIFTVLPILAIAFEDVDIPDSLIENISILYSHGMDNLSFGFRNFIGCVLNGMWVSLVIFSASFFTGIADISSNGQVGDLWVAGTACFGFLVISLNILVLFFHSSMVLRNWLVVLASMVVYFPLVYIYCSILSYNSDTYGVANILFGRASFWFSLIISIVACVLPFYIYRCISELIYPDLITQIRNRISQTSEEEVLKEYLYKSRRFSTIDNHQLSNIV